MAYTGSGGTSSLFCNIGTGDRRLDRFLQQRHRP